MSKHIDQSRVSIFTTTGHSKKNLHPTNNENSNYIWVYEYEFRNQFDNIYLTEQ